MILVLRFGCLLSPILALFFDAELDEGWRAFKLEYGRQFDDPVENIQRRVIWERMMHFIETHNREAAAGLHSYTVGPNQFSDMTTEEFISTMNGFNETLDLNKNVRQMYSPPKDIRIENYNTTVDWRLNGATGNLVSLSEQNIVDCSFTQGNMGCNGGNMNKAFQYLKENGGIDSEKSYPYTQSVGKCNIKAKHNGANMTACKNILQGSERDLQIAVALEGPVSVGVDASQRGFQSYKSGIYDDPKCTRTLDHAVLIVGYGTEGGKDYWLVKNSWGTKWGDKGYIKMSRNNKNQCGIANTASFPMV